MKINRQILKLALGLFLTINAFGQIPTNGLVAYYPFNGNANDESGNGNNGNYQTSTLFGTGRISNVLGSASSFTGSNYISVNTTLGNFGVNDFSISVWFNSSSTAGDNRIIAKRRDGGLTTNFFAMQVGNGQFATELSSPTSSYIYIYPTLIQAQKWYHVIYQREGNNLRVYLNNQLINSTTLQALLILLTQQIY